MLVWKYKKTNDATYGPKLGFITVPTATGNAMIAGGVANLPKIGVRAFTKRDYTAAPANPTLSGISPDTGLATGGVTVTLTGTGYTPTTVATFDGLNRPTTYIGPTSVSFVTPVSTVATHLVRAVNGTDASPSQTYTAT